MEITLKSQTQAGEMVPLSFTQQRLWFLAQFQPDNYSYNVGRIYRIYGPLHVPSLEKSFRYIFNRHQALRTRFILEQNSPYQLVNECGHIPIEEVVISGNSVSRKESKLQEKLTTETHRKFDLEKGDLLRVTLYRLDRRHYVLQWVIHHIVSDAWSSGILIRELNYCYQAFVSGKTPDLPQSTVQYTDYSVWQQQCYQAGLLAKQRTYWLEQLSQLEVLRLPIDKPRTKRLSTNGRSVSLFLGEKLSKRLKKMGQQVGCTPYMILLTIFQLFLSRYCGQKDISIGTPIANRQLPETEKLIGFFANTLVMRTIVNDEYSFLELLERVKETCFEAYDNQDMPFEKLVEGLNPERNISQNPLFQVMFVFLNWFQTKLQLPDLDIEVMPSARITSLFDLMLTARQLSDDLQLEFVYKTDLFHHQTIKRLLKNYVHLVDAVVDTPQKTVASFSLMTASEQQVILTEWSHGDGSSLEQKGIHQVFEQQAELFATADAVIFNTEKLTYRELNNRSNQLANYLQRQGLRPDEVVGLFLDQGLNLIVSLLAVLKAGCAYLPLDPTNPKTRLAYMVQDAAPCALITDHQHPVPPTIGCTNIINLDVIREKLATTTIGNLDCKVSPENLAYTIYTSGSTGKPKGIEQVHRTLLNLASWYATHIGQNSNVRKLQYGAWGFDSSILDFVTCWHNGSALIMVRDEVKKDPRLLLDFLCHNNIHCINIISIVLEHLAREANRQNRYPKVLREIITTGEQLVLTAEIRLFFSHLQDCHYYNFYGPSETQVVTCYHAASLCDVPDRVPIGKPVDNSRIYILDPDLNLLPIGVGGEVYIAGYGLARGYRFQKGLTTNRFVLNPFAMDSDDLMYKSGDWARWLVSGDIEFLGRNDRQIKIRGHRVELAEIEYSIAQHDLIKAVIADVIIDQDDQRLIVYVVLEDTVEEMWESNLRSMLKDRLPGYMIPASIIRLENLPLTPTGKRDRRALAKMPRLSVTLSYKHKPPRTQTEKILSRLWDQILRPQKNIGIYDSFFDLGGHSLLAVRLIHEIEQEFQKTISLVAVLENFTIYELARHLDESKDVTTIALI